MNKIGLYFSVFIISFFGLLLEFLQIRIFSFQYWYHFVYFAITIAMLGIFFSGVIFALWRKLQQLPEIIFYSFCFLGFGMAASLGTFAITFLRGDFFQFWSDSANLFVLLLTSLTAMIPYVFLGLFLVKAWHHNSEFSGRIYFLNLLGSAGGILAYTLLLKPLGLNNLLLVLTGGSFIAAIILIAKSGFLWKFIYFILVLLSVFSVFAIKIKPDKNKLYWWFYEKAIPVFSEWNPIARIDVIKDGNSGSMTILNDGDAQSPLVPADLKNLNKDSPLDKMNHREPAYAARGRDKIPDRVLVIGAGGGADVLTAYKYGAKNIDAIEINPTTARIVKENFSKLIGNIFRQKNVNLFIEDGRSFAERTQNKYDIIVIIGIDSLAALNSGAYMMAENYPYTIEAFKRYWDILNQDGVIQISRFYYPEAPRETLRVFTTFFEALRERGISNPAEHILVVAEKDAKTPFGSVLVFKEPIKKQVLGNFNRWLKSNTGLSFVFPMPEVNGSAIFADFAKNFAENKESDFYDKYFYNIRPATDNKPFFFQYNKLNNLFKNTGIKNDVAYYNNIRQRWPVIVLFSLLIITSLIVLVVSIFLTKKIKPVQMSVLPIFYFSALGVAFMFLELSLIQKLVLFIRHPVYSMSVVIPFLLSGAGVGSFTIKKFKSKTVFLAFSILPIVILAAMFLLSSRYALFLLQLNFPSALLSVAISIFSIGFFMGIPFPVGLSKINRENIPIAWSLNGGFSVIGSILAIILAMTIGFDFVMISSAIIYATALFCLIVWE